MLYKMQMIPNSCHLHFLWHIGLCVGPSYGATNPHELNGLSKCCRSLGLPDLQHYFWAVHLSRVVDWKIHERCKGWVGLGHLVSGAELRIVPSFHKEHISPSLYAHPLIGATLHAFDRACTGYTLFFKECSITPLRGNPTFVPGLARIFLAAEWPHREIQARHFF